MLEIERFDYVRFGELLAVVELSAGLDREWSLSEAELSVQFGGYRATSPAWVPQLARRSSWWRRDGSLAWSASFAVALELVEYPTALFVLTAQGLPALSLPPPDLRSSLISARQSGRVQSMVGRRAATAAVTVAVTTAATPALSFAAAHPRHANQPIVATSQLVKPAVIDNVLHPLARRHTAALTAVHLASAAPVHVARSQQLTLPRVHAAIPHHAASSHHAVGPRDVLTPHRASAPRHKVTAPHAGAPHHKVSAPHAGAPHHKVSAPHAGAPHHKVTAPHTGTSGHKVTAPHTGTSGHKVTAGHTGTTGHKLTAPHAGSPHQPSAPRPQHPPHTASHHHPSGGAPIATRPTVPPPPVHVSPHIDPDHDPAPPTVVPAAPTSGPTAAPAPSSGANSALAAAYGRLSGLFARGSQPPAFLIPIYKAAGRRYHVPWRILAAINWVETDYGRNMSTSSAGAIGWMQFMPSTWTEYGVDVHHRGRPNPYDPHDAIFAAARYLAANGARHHLRQAIFAYNHASWYVDEVLTKAAGIADLKLRPGAHARMRLRAMRTMARLLNGDPYVWGGGHGDWQLVSGYDCSGFVSAVLHAGGYLSAPQTTQTLPAQPGILSGPGRFVTIFDRTDAGGDDHVIIDIGGEWWESGGTSNAGVHRITDISPEYVSTFNLVLHPRGL